MIQYNCQKREEKGTIMTKLSYNRSMELCEAIENGAHFEVVEDKWYDVFSAVLMSFDFNSDSIVFLWNTLVTGNWKRLHLTEDEEQIAKDEWLNKFHWEVFYCSDRWSFDRLMRCHWLYRVWKKKH